MKLRTRINRLEDQLASHVCQIASEEGIDTGTAGRILTHQEVVQLKAQARSRLFGMVPKAIQAYEAVFRSNDLHLKAATGTKVLETTGVLQKAGVEQTAPELDRQQRRFALLGQMTEMFLQKKQRYGIVLPPELDQLAEELKERTGDAES